MPQRPKLWIHRTRRFWVGLVILLLLLAGYFISGEGSLECSATRFGTASNDYGTYVELELERGGLLVSKQLDPFAPTRSMMGRTWSFYFNSSYASLGTKLTPDWDYDPDEWHLFIPLWPLPILWAAFWISRMVRAERRELKKFSESDDE